MKASLKEICNRESISYTDILWKYVAEDFLWRINTNHLDDILWLQKPEYNKNEKLSLYYIEKANTKKNTELQELLDKIISDKEIRNKSDIQWQGIQKQTTFMLTAICDDIEIPFSVKIRKITEESAGSPQKKEIEPLNHSHKKFVINTYSPESILGQQIFEIMDKLELIGDMNIYISVYKILNKNSISGRHIMDILKMKSQIKPKIVSMRRIEQIKEYKTYAYMKKRWIQCAKKSDCDAEWEDALDIITSFIEPVWNALCNNEIFFDDWMPELGRFLG